MKKLAAFSLVASLVIVGWGCTEESSEKTVITVIGENTSNTYAFMTLEEEYERLHPDIDLVFKAEPYEELTMKVNQDFSKGLGQNDIVMLYAPSISPFVRNDYVFTLDELLGNNYKDKRGFESDIFEKTWFTVASYFKDPKKPESGYEHLGYPFSANSMLLMYNKEMFADPVNKANYLKKFGKELAVPNTWEDFKNVASFFTDKTKKQYGVCVEGGAGGWLYFEWMNYLFGMGGEVIDRDAGWQSLASSPVVLTDKASLAAAAFFDELRPYNAGNFTDVGQFEEMTIMKEKKTAMAIAWDDVISSNVQADSTGDFAKTFGFAPIPGERSIIGGGAFFVNKKTKNKEAVAEFILYLMQKDTQVKLAKKGLSSPLKSVYDDPEIQKYPHTAALKASLTRGGGYLDAGPEADAVIEILTTYLQKAWSDEMSATEAMTKARKELEAERASIYKQLQ